MEDRVDILRPVALILIILEGAGDDIGRLNGIQPGLHVAHMGRPATHRHPGPDHANLAGIQRLHPGPGLGDDHSVAFRQSEQAGGGAIAGAFLLDHRMHLHLGRGLQPSLAQGGKGQEIGGDSALHIPRTTAINPPAANLRRIGRAGPHISRPLRHHIDMALQHQGPATHRARLMHRHHIVAPLIGDQRRREDRIPVWHRGNAARGEAQRLILPGHFIEGGCLIAQGAGTAHQAEQTVQSGITQPITGLEDGAPGAGVERNHGAEYGARPRRC